MRGAEADPDVVAGVHMDPHGIWVTWTFGDRDIQGPVGVLVRDDWVVSAAAYVGGRRVASAASRVLNSAGAATTAAAAAVIAAAVACPCGAIRLEDDVDVVAVRDLAPAHVDLCCAAGRLGRALGRGCGEVRRRGDGRAAAIQERAVVTRRVPVEERVETAALSHWCLHPRRTGNAVRTTRAR